jgi:hypothetical protein
MTHTENKLTTGDDHISDKLANGKRSETTGSKTRLKLSALKIRGRI